MAVWTEHTSKSTGKVYYYNNETKKSTFKKPDDFDGGEDLAPKAAPKADKLASAKPADQADSGKKPLLPLPVPLPASTKAPAPSSGERDAGPSRSSAGSAGSAAGGGSDAPAPIAREGADFNLMFTPPRYAMHRVFPLFGGERRGSRRAWKTAGARRRFAAGSGATPIPPHPRPLSCCAPRCVRRGTAPTPPPHHHHHHTYPGTRVTHAALLQRYTMDTVHPNIEAFRFQQFNMLRNDLHDDIVHKMRIKLQSGRKNSNMIFTSLWAQFVFLQHACRDEFSDPLLPDNPTRFDGAPCLACARALHARRCWTPHCAAERVAPAPLRLRLRLYVCVE